LTASSIANVIGIILFNTVPLWRQYTQGVVLEDFVRILWAANLSFLGAARRHLAEFPVRGAVNLPFGR
jgi:hypothetical protein